MTVEAFPDRLLQPGDLVGPFRMGTLLGSGGMGQVFLAEDERAGVDVALKILHPRWSGDDWLVELFHKEAELVRGLSHPNLVALLDVGEEPERDLHYLIFEFIHGIPLDRLIEEGPQDPQLAASVIQDMALGLAAAHAAGVVHRDVKPANVMITPDDHIKLIDFGVADRTGSGSTGEIPRDIAGPGTTGVCGTRVYAAPEQNQGRPASPAADVYSLAVVGWELYAGERLFPDGEIVEVLQRQAGLQAALDKGMALHPRIPEPIDRVLRRALQLIPEDRYGSAGEMLRDLEEAIEAGGGVPEGALRRSKQTALVDLADSLLLRAQASLDREEYAAAAAEFARVLALEPPNRELFVNRVRESVQKLFWNPEAIGYFPIRLLDMLGELRLHDLRYLVEHRLAASARGEPEVVLGRLGVYLNRWPESAAFLRAASAAARALGDGAEAEYLRRLGDALLDMGEASSAMRCYRDARAAATQAAAPVPTDLVRSEERALELIEEHVGPAERFHESLRAAAALDDPSEQAELWAAFLSETPGYGPAMMEAARVFEKAGDRIRAARLSSELGRRAFVAGALKEARRWLTAAVRLDPDREEALLYLAEMTGGVPEGENVRAQRVAVLRRAGLAEAALYHREKDLTGGERDREILAEMADIAVEWRLDPTALLIRRGRLELDAGRDDEARELFVEALERAPDPVACAERLLKVPGVVRALGSSMHQELHDRVRAHRTESEAPRDPSLDLEPEGAGTDPGEPRPDSSARTKPQAGTASAPGEPPSTGS